MNTMSRFSGILRWGLAGFLCLPFCSDVASAKIRWSQPQIKRMMIPGQTGTETVTFSSDTNQTNVNLSVVPALQPYLSVSPALISSLKANTPYVLSVSIAVPRVATVGTLVDGTIHAMVQNTTLSVPLEFVLDIEAASSRSSDPGSIVQDGISQYPVNEIVLTFPEGSSFLTAQRFASSFNGVVVGAIPEVDTYQVLVGTTTISQLSSLITQLQNTAVPPHIGVSRNYITGVPGQITTDQHKTDLENLARCPGDQSFVSAYDSVRIEQAWQLIRFPGSASRELGIPRHTTVGVLDTGVQTIVGTGNSGPVYHPEFTAPKVDFGRTPPESLNDSSIAHGGHGTEVAGIIGASNHSDPDFGFTYDCASLQMNGILSGIPHFASGYTLEERAGAGTTLTTAIANANAAITSGAQIVLLEFGATTLSNLTFDQQNACGLIGGTLGSVELELWYYVWFKFFNEKHPNVLFVLPANNWNQFLPSLTQRNQLAQAVDIVAGINLDNTITVAAFDPRYEETSPNYRATWNTNILGVCTASNYGPGVEIAAPGKNVYAPKPTDLNHLNPMDFYNNDFTGTSAAAPFVTGVAGLIYAMDSSLPVNTPNAVPSYIKNRILATTDNLSSSLEIGNRLNACRAVKETLGMSFDLVSATPSNAASSVPTDLASITLNFSIPIDVLSLPQNLFAATDGHILLATLQPGSDPNQQYRSSLVFNVSQALEDGSKYSLDLTGVRDLCGDPSASTTSYSFTTAQSGIISNISVSNITGCSATITFTTSVPALSQILYGTNGTLNNSDATTATYSTTHSHTITNLQPGTTYSFEVSVFANNALTDSNPQTFTTSTTPCPGIISNISVSNITGCSATITFATSVPALSQILYGTNGLLNNSDAVSGPSTTHSHTLSNLQLGTTYSFEVSVFANNVLTDSNRQTFTTGTTPCPGIISNIAVSNVTSNSATITFTTSVAALSQILYGTNGILSNSDATIGPTTVHSHTLANLQSGTTYTFEVSVFANGVLTDSAPQTFTTQ